MKKLSATKLLHNLFEARVEKNAAAEMGIGFAAHCHLVILPRNLFRRKQFINRRLLSLIC